MWRNKDIENLSPKLQFALLHSLDQGSYPAVFPLDYGLDFDVNDCQEDCSEYNVVSYNSPRQVRIKISSFIGSCAWAQHYYADIEADGVLLCKIGKTNDGHPMRQYKSVPIKDSYSYEEKAKYKGWYKISVQREVTLQMIYDNPDMWEGYDVGDTTHRFNAKNDALKMAKKIVKERFPGWEVKVENY